MIWARRASALAASVACVHKSDASHNGSRESSAQNMADKNDSNGREGGNKGCPGLKYIALHSTAMHGSTAVSAERWRLCAFIFWTNYNGLRI